MTDDSATLRAMMLAAADDMDSYATILEHSMAARRKLKEMLKAGAEALVSQSSRAKEKEELQTALGKCAIELGILQHDKAGLERQRARLIELMNDREFIRTLHDYRRGHLSYFNQIGEQLGELRDKIEPWCHASRPVTVKE